MKKLRLVLSFLTISTISQAQISVEELVAIRTQPKLDAVAFLQSKGFKLDSCAEANPANADLSSVCYFRLEKTFDDKKAVSTLKISFSKTRRNHLEYVPLQQGFGLKVMNYMKSLKIREEPYDLIKEQKYGKKYHTIEGWTYDVSASLKTPDTETIYVLPTKP